MDVVAVSKGVSAHRFTKDSRKGSLPYPRNAAQRGSVKSAPHEARDHAARLIRVVAAPEVLLCGVLRCFTGSVRQSIRIT